MDLFSVLFFEMNLNMVVKHSYVRYIGNVKLSIEKNGEKEGLWEQMFFGSNKDAIIRDKI
ncbi:hypothetical protein [Clostridium sp. YIM B02555]|uniref:hypothetical protein n=1 Tax=Clostridium sp. YIM B02555 TaxID=2911968 RepID=UPI001EEEC5B3|nr:hypothetical protein [Clostridium sp. YIM B02555]